MSKGQITFSPAELEAPLQYINRHWQELERYKPRDEATLIGLPKPYIVPSDNVETGFAFNEMYYWDSYFTAAGLIGTPKESLAFDFLDNMVALIKRFGMVPNGSRFYLTSHSQPPFLTTLIFELYAIKPNKKWLRKYIDIAKYEYRDVWLSAKHPHWRKVYRGLSRYYDTNVLHSLAEAESGWDMTPRFNRECLNYVPIDLNSLLFKYESDFAAAAYLLGSPDEAKQWQRRADTRRQMINSTMWDAERGFYFDYNFVKGHASPIWSLAGYYPLWAGLASRDQARQLVDNLAKFEHRGGLAATAQESAPTSPVPEQWAYPNGWAPLHLLVAQGLSSYGFHKDAERIARKWLRTNLDVFKTAGQFYEKYNVVDPSRPAQNGLYPAQSGFGWTNAIFNRLCFEFLKRPELPVLSNLDTRRASQLAKQLERQIAGARVKFPSPKTKPSF